MASESLTAIFEFNSAPDLPYWRIVNDRVMGGQSTSSFSITPDRTGQFSGLLSLEYGGGFCSLRFTRPLSLPGSMQGFRLRCRGDGKQYQFRAYPGSQQSDTAFTHPFQAPADSWQELTLLLGDFSAVRRGTRLDRFPPLEAGSIREIGLLIADQQAGPFSLELEWIAAFIPQ